MTFLVDIVQKEELQKELKLEDEAKKAWSKNVIDTKVIIGIEAGMKVIFFYHLISRHQAQISRKISVNTSARRAETNTTTAGEQ